MRDRGQAKVGFRAETRRDERLCIVQLNIRHQVDQWTTNVERLDVAVEIFKRVLELKIAEYVAVRGPLNSACVPDLCLHS
jgi:hypothetical protein